MPVQSPCNDVCKISPDSGLCQGCLRTKQEIMLWKDASDGQKRAILNRLKSRKI